MSDNCPPAMQAQATTKPPYVRSMKAISLALSGAALALVLTGCSTADPYETTLEECKSKIMERKGEGDYELSLLQVEDLPTALKEADIPDPDNEAEGKITVWGDITFNGEAFSVLCTADYAEGEAVVVGSHPIITVK